MERQVCSGCLGNSDTMEEPQDPGAESTAQGMLPCGLHRPEESLIFDCEVLNPGARQHPAEEGRGSYTSTGGKLS